MLQRYYHEILNVLPEKKVLIIYGPRRVGKTTLLHLLLENSTLKYRIDSGENIRIMNLLGSQDFNLLREYVSGYELIIIDEAQNIPGIGLGLKILIDQFPDLKIIATGSSSFDLENQTGEPLTGRKKVIILFPFSQLELNIQHNRFEIRQLLDQFLIFGSYPEVYMADSNKERIEMLQELVNSYLLKDIMGLERLRNPKQLTNLLKLLAFQVGQEVSIHELSKTVGLNVRTVERYLVLLEKGFVIFRLGSYSRNLRTEVTKKSKYYFYDNGIRNGIILQFNNLDLRNDTGQLWENFIISERLKYLSYNRIFANRYFWRNYNQQEIDYIEEVDGKLIAYEIKWNKNKAKIPNEFAKEYKIKELRTINRDNYLDFLISDQ